MQRHIRLRHEAALAARNYMSRQRLPRDRDAHPGQSHARGRPRLPRPQPRLQGPLLRPAPVAPAVQADPDDLRLRPLFPDRPLLPGRGPAGRPPARVHPDRHRDELHRPGRLLRPQRRPDGGPLRPRRPEGRAAVPAPALRRGHGEVRLGQARPARAARDARPDRGRPRDRAPTSSRPSSPRGGELKGLLVPGAGASRAASSTSWATRPRRSGPRA